jgi:hypothetical protein
MESPNNLLEIIKGMRGSSSVESLGKLCEMKALDKGLPKKCHSRKIDSVFPGNGAKNVIAQSVLAQSPRKVRDIGIKNRISYHCHLNRKSPLSRDRRGLPLGRQSLVT